MWCLTLWGYTRSGYEACKSLFQNPEKKHSPRLGSLPSSCEGRDLLQHPIRQFAPSPFMNSAQHDNILQVGVAERDFSPVRQRRCGDTATGSAWESCPAGRTFFLSPPCREVWISSPIWQNVLVIFFIYCSAMRDSPGRAKKKFIIGRHGLCIRGFHIVEGTQEGHYFA